MDPNELQQSIDLIKTNLQPLADKLGQTAGWTYAIFIKQVYVNAFVNLLWVVLGIISAVLIKKCLEWDKNHEGWGIFLAVAFGLASLVMILVPMVGLIQVTINPDYSAIKLIIDTIKTTTRNP